MWVAIRESFICEMLYFNQSAKVFTCKKVPATRSAKSQWVWPRPQTTWIAISSENAALNSRKQGTSRLPCTNPNQSVSSCLAFRSSLCAFYCFSPMQKEQTRSWYLPQQVSNDVDVSCYLHSHSIMIMTANCKLSFHISCSSLPTAISHISIYVVAAYTTKLFQAPP